MAPKKMAARQRPGGRLLFASGVAGESGLGATRRSLGPCAAGRQAILGTQRCGYGAQGGTLIVQDDADSRAGIRLSGADLIIAGKLHGPLRDELVRHQAGFEG